jgi:hypothetical protein
LGLSWIRQAKTRCWRFRHRHVSNAKRFIPSEVKRFTTSEVKRFIPSEAKRFIPSEAKRFTTSEALRSRLQNEDGSISVLVFGLFAVVLLSGVVLTDISAILVAHRSLVQATESAAQSAAHALDLETYYEGKHSVLSFLVSDASPVIPIDCAVASRRASETLADIASNVNRNYGGQGNRQSGSGDRQSGSGDRQSGFGDRQSGSNDRLDGSGKELVRHELTDIQISNFQCNGSEVLITTSAKAWLPISLSLFSFESVDLSASAGTTSVKKRVLSIFGINF